MTIQFYLEFVRDALQLARKVAREVEEGGEGGKPLGKGSYGDETFYVDRAVEDAVLQLAAKRLPRFSTVSEERGIAIDPAARLTMLLDPVDGSTNAKKGLPAFSTSLALAEGPLFRDIFVAGVIDHATGRMVWGSRGRVYEDWYVAVPSEASDLKEAVIGFDSKAYKVPEEKLGALVRLFASTKYPRVLSTAALETAYVASGRLDAFVAPYAKLRSFDCLPALFLVKGAGGRVKVLSGELDELPLDGSKEVDYVAAGSEGLLRAILEILP